MSNSLDGNPKELGTAWLGFYNYVRLPLGILLSLSEIVKLCSNLNSPNLFLLIFDLLFCVLIIEVIVGLHQRKYWDGV